jgi:sugar/nucleoside kinase (ribokinase family)
VCITLGEHGCLLCQPSGPVQLPAVPVPPPLDTVGAGDSFLAGLAAGLGARAAADESAQLAILAAGVTVRKLHVTGTATPAEIIDIFDTYLGQA